VLALAASIIAAALLYPITIEAFQVLAPSAPYELLKSFSFLWFPTQLPAFLMGILIFRLLHDTSPAFPRCLFDLGSMIALVAALALPLATGSTKILFVAYVFDFGILTLCLGRGGGRFLTIAPIRFLGTISYSGYFWHFAVLRVIERLGLSSFGSAYPGWLQFLSILAAVAALTVMLATATHRLIEMPMIHMGRKLADYKSIPFLDNPQDVR
jgi:peptidoglycan/LPS O-acetylase OafA/YrhL